MTANQAELLIAGVSGDRLGGLYTLVLLTALRAGEALGLRWSDIDLGASSLRVTRALYRAMGEYQFVEPKSTSSRRTLVLPPTAVESLREHRKIQLRERLAAGDEWQDEEGLVFTTELGRPLNPSSMTRRFQGKMKELGLPMIRFHDLRHTTATLLVSRGVHMRLIAEVLGHSQISLAMDRYSHVQPAMRTGVADQIEAAVGGGG